MGAVPPTICRTRGDDGEVFFVGTGAPAEVYQELAQMLRDEGARVIQERIFGSLSSRAEILAARAEALGEGGTFSYMEGAPLWGEGFAGVIVRAVYASTDVVVLQGLRGETREVIAEAEKRLRPFGLAYWNVVRTWFYLDDILSWYDQFNQARTAAYTKAGLPHLPASTGIGARNPGRTPVSLDLFATRAPVKILHSPRQPEASQYGASFARGARVGNLIEVSGTASIDAAGKSVFPGDVRAQLEHTLANIAALIAGEGAALHDIAAGTLFLKRREDWPAVQEVLAERGLNALRVVGVVADICRPELLVEIDAEVLIAAR
jgi:enamine deaminase RidA (YjgF/YER057c/UK114 family)